MKFSQSRIVDAKTARWWTWTTYLFIFGCIILLTVRYTLNSELQSISSEEFWRQSRMRAFNHTTMHHNLMAGKDHGYLFPKMVHQTWKSKSIPPHQTLRWRAGCKELNPHYEFKMFDDDDLMSFTLKYYPKYGTVLQALKGVYMADMARVILAFHFGGIYMDLDFYCHRPMQCLEHYALNLLSKHRPFQNVTRSHLIQHRVNLLLVPREPLIHGYYLHGRPRVVIQDLYMSTPKHPFLQWLLDDLTTDFIHNNYTLNQKGPLSYSIDPLLDEYYKNNNFTTLPSTVQSQRTSVAYLADDCNELFQDAANLTDFNVEDIHVPHTRSLGNNGRGKCQIIIEVDENVLHPLVDASNHRLQEKCYNPPDITSPTNSNKYAVITDAQRISLQQRCERLLAGKYLAANLDETVLVHMWTHSFLDWSFLRGWYDQGTYVNVERTLPATKSCPAAWAT